jgi:hypothetical protein
VEHQVPLVGFSGDKCVTLFSHPLIDTLHEVYYEPKVILFFLFEPRLILLLSICFLGYPLLPSYVSLVTFAARVCDHQMCNNLFTIFLTTHHHSIFWELVCSDCQKVKCAGNVVRSLVGVRSSVTTHYQFTALVCNDVGIGGTICSWCLA